MRLIGFILLFTTSIAWACPPGNRNLEPADEDLTEFAEDFVEKEKVCNPPITGETVQKMIDELIVLYFPELQGREIPIVEFESDAFYLQAKFGNILQHAKKRNYAVEVNSKLYPCPPSMDALWAIVAHELYHITDYLKRGTFRMIGLGLSYSSKKSRHKYERNTDLRVLELGKKTGDYALIRGIKEYREWIYPKLTEEDLAKKRAQYYTPEEVNQFATENNIDISKKE